jgi:hypothetical protein
VEVRRPERKKTVKCGGTGPRLNDSFHGELQGDEAEPAVVFDLLGEVWNDGKDGAQ